MAGNTSKRSNEDDEVERRGPLAQAAAEPATATLSPPRRLGRRAAAGLYYLTVAAIAVASLIQITQQVFFPQPPSALAPFSSCVDGLRQLYQAIERGRHAAETPDPHGEMRKQPCCAIEMRSRRSGSIVTPPLDYAQNNQTIAIVST